MKTKTSNSLEILKSAKNIAVIGCSPDPYRTSNYAAKYLMEMGYQMIPINPKEDKILGEKCYPDLNSIPKDVRINIVNIFRRSEHTEGVVEEVIAWKKETGQNPVIWTQLNVSSTKAELKAEEADIPYVRNKCIMVELDHLR